MHIFLRNLTKYLLFDVNYTNVDNILLLFQNLLIDMCVTLFIMFVSAYRLYQCIRVNNLLYDFQEKHNKRQIVCTH